MRGDRQRQHEHVAVDAGREAAQPGNRDRDDEEVDGDEVERKEPGGLVEIAPVGVLDDDDVELPRQAQDRGEREPGHGHPGRAVDAAEEDAAERRVGGHVRGEIAHPRTCPR